MLSDTIRFVDLTVWPELAMVIFVGVFFLVCWRTLRSSRSFTSAMAAAALDQDDAQQVQAGEQDGKGARDGE